MVTQERADEVRTLLATLREWAQGRPDVVAVGLAGSWARGDARMDSDVDAALVTEDRGPYLEEDAWVRDLGGGRPVGTRRWGPMTWRRFIAPSGLEVEVGAGLPPGSTRTTRACAGPPRTAPVVYDPKGILAGLLDACGRPEPS